MPAKFRIDRHLRKFKRVVFVWDHRYGSRHCRIRNREEHLSARSDHCFVRMIENVVIVLFDAVCFGDPVIIQVGKILCVRRIEFYDLEGLCAQLLNELSMTESFKMIV